MDNERPLPDVLDLTNDGKDHLWRVLAEDIDFSVDNVPGKGRRSGKGGGKGAKGKGKGKGDKGGKSAKGLGSGSTWRTSHPYSETRTPDRF